VQVLLRRAPGEVPEPYLGLLYPTEDFRVYGYITNSATKFVLVLDQAAAGAGGAGGAGAGASARPAAAAAAAAAGAHAPSLVSPRGVDERELRALFRRLHALYVDASSNPMYTYGSPITSRRFDEGVAAILRSYG
jgi:hypothetical protein